MHAQTTKSGLLIVPAACARGSVPKATRTLSGLVELVDKLCSISRSYALQHFGAGAKAFAQSLRSNLKNLLQGQPGRLSGGAVLQWWDGRVEVAGLTGSAPPTTFSWSRPSLGIFSAPSSLLVNHRFFNPFTPHPSICSYFSTHNRHHDYFQGTPYKHAL